MCEAGPAAGKKPALMGGAGGAGGPAEAAWLRLDNAARTTMPALEAAAGRADQEGLAAACSELRLSLAVARTDLADAEASARVMDGGEASALRARVAAARSLHDVLEARLHQILDERGACGPADLSISEERIDFADTELGGESELAHVWVRNLGIGPVSLDELRGPDEFPVHGLCEPQPLGPGEALMVEIGFRPTELGRRLAKVRIETDGGVRTSGFLVRGRGIEPTPESKERARVDHLTADARAGADLAPPRTFDELRDLLLTARRFEELGDRSTALRCALVLRDAVHEIANPVHMQETFSRYGLARTGTELLVGGELDGHSNLVARLQLGAEINWDHQLNLLDAAREPIQLLTGELHDSPALRRVQHAANVTAAVAGGAVVGAATLPLIAGEAGLLATGAGNLGRTAWMWGAMNPGAAAAIGTAAAGIGSDIAELGPVDWARSLGTPEGVLNLVFDLLQIYDAHLSDRIATGDVVDETIGCHRGEGAARTGDLRRAGGEVVSDAVEGGARVVRVRTDDGRLVELAEPGTLRPPLTRPSMRDRVNALRLQLSAVAARRTIARRDAQLAALIEQHREGEHIPHLFDRALAGGGHASVLDYATLPGRPPRPDGEMTDLPGVIAIGGGETFGERGEPLGQPPPEVAHEAHAGHQPGDLSARSIDYVPAGAFTDAVTLTRDQTGMATLRDHKVVAMSTSPEHLTRVEGARVRITLETPRGETRYLYSRSADVVCGPGPARQLGPDQLDPSWRQRMERDGRMIYEAIGRARKAIRVLVSGGAPTGDWNALAVARTGTDVDWVGRPIEPTEGPHLAELAEIRSHLTDSSLSPLERARLERRRDDILGFRDAMLDRNAGADGAMAHPSVHRHTKAIALVTPSEEMTIGRFAGRPGKVHVRFSDGSEDWYDYVVISHGQDASLPGGPVAITQGISMKLADADGLPYVESTDGSIRVLGAASFSTAWKTALGNDRGLVWEQASREAAERLSPFSLGISPSIQMAGRQISAANRTGVSTDD